MKKVKWYPSWVYSVREDWTRANMARYDRMQEAIDKRCLEINPDYFRLDIRSRFAVRRQAETDLNY
jgi:hypothetical protein